MTEHTLIEILRRKPAQNDDIGQKYFALPKPFKPLKLQHFYNKPNKTENERFSK